MFPNIPWNNINDMTMYMLLIYNYMDKWKINNISDLNELLNQNYNFNNNIMSCLTKVKDKYPTCEVIKYFHNSKDLQCIISKNPCKKRITIVFRGTDSWTDWTQDFNIWQKDIGNNVWVHSGFYNQLHNDGSFDKIKEQLRKLLENNKDWDIYITGHSLGGAQSILSSYLLSQEFPKQKFYVFSFASPKVGNKEFKTSYNSAENIKHYRICYHRDYITSTPSFGYYHVGDNLWYDKNNKKWTYYAKNKSINYYSYYFCNPLDHSCINYLSAVESTYNMDIKKIKYVI